METSEPMPSHRTRRRFRRSTWLRAPTARPRTIQRSFGFIQRTERRARRLKLSILAVMTLLAGLLVVGTSSGRYATGWTATRARWAVQRAIGLPIERGEIDAARKQRRLREIEQTRAKLTSDYAECPDPMRRLLDYAGLDPDHALVRWGKLNETLVLPATVFEADDAGRSFRFRPGVRSIWIRNPKQDAVFPAYFPAPLTPQLDRLAREAGASVVPAPVQTANSWGLRGPEPATNATLRGIVLGDAYMQGLFVADAETPVERLKRYLSERTGEPTEILNTGHLGYSPEQKYFTLRAYADQIRPRFVVLSLSAGDFGDPFEVLEGKGDWEEGKYWLGEIAQFCRSRNIELLVVPVPWVDQIEGPRRSGFYPGLASNIVESGGSNYLNPFDAFADETLRLRLASTNENSAATPNPLFNGRHGDAHFSPLGCELWARVVSERLLLVLEAHGG